MYKIFGSSPKKALTLLKEGKSKDEIFEQTSQSVGVNNANFKVKTGEIFVIMGLSGSGKSTLVRLLNRLIEPTFGEILLNGEDITSMNKTELRRVRRDEISMVFQSFALMPHLNIIDNVALGLEFNGVGKKERYEKAREALRQVELEMYESSYPDELSGGMQQRVGLARALANNPPIMLMDEAFSALDPLIRSQMQDELLDIQEKHRRTIIFISHDLNEAIKLGDRIAIMQDGMIVQIGTPEDIVSNPKNEYVRSFFRGVDITSILSASHIAQKSYPTLMLKEGLGIKAAIQYINDLDYQTGYILDKNRYVGVVTLTSLEEQLKAKGNILDAVIKQDFIHEDTPISEFIGTIAQYPYPVAVVDKDKKFKGTISKNQLLKIFDEGVENG